MTELRPIRNNGLTPSSPNLNDGTIYTLGTVFKCTEAGHKCLGGSFYKSSTDPSGNVPVTLYELTSDTTGTQLWRNTYPSSSFIAGWNDLYFTTAVDLDPAKYYVIAYTTPDNFAATGGGFVGHSYSDGPVTVIADTVPYRSGRFTAADGFPDGGSGSNYFIDPIVDAFAPVNNAQLGALAFFL